MLSPEAQGSPDVDALLQMIQGLGGAQQGMPQGLPPQILELLMAGNPGLMGGDPDPNMMPMGGGGMMPGAQGQSASPLMAALGNC